jgi:N utilization substance protein A
MQALSGGPSTPIEHVTELGEGIIQKLVAAGITTVESLADMTPEQLEEIPGIGEKTLERISVAVRHYFGHFEEGEEGAPESAESAELDAEHAEADAAAGEEDFSVESAAKKAGEAEIANADAVEADAEAEGENAEDVLEEAESTQAAEAETDILDNADNDALAETEAEEASETLEELAVEDAPVAGDEAELDLDEIDNERVDKEGGA